MRRLFLIVLSLVALVLAGGCGGKAEAYTDPAQRIGTGAGQEFIIALDSNPTTGYTWEESHDEALLELVEKTFEPGQTAKKGAVGVGGTEQFRFKALKAGSTNVTLTYKRAWEKEALKQQIFTVEIQ